MFLGYADVMDNFFYQALVIGGAGLVAGSFKALETWLVNKLRSKSGLIFYWLSADLEIALPQAMKAAAHRRRLRQAGLAEEAPNTEDLRKPSDKRAT